jgi:type III secretory pathway component EscV
MKPSDLFLVIVAGYVIYKMGFVDGATPVNFFILVCLIVAVITTILTRTGTLGRWEKKKEEAEQKLQEQKDHDSAHDKEDDADQDPSSDEESKPSDDKDKK